MIGPWLSHLLLLGTDINLSCDVSRESSYGGQQGLTGWGAVVSSPLGRFPFLLLAFCSLLRATAMQLPTLALFWISARSVWCFFEEN